MRKFFRNIRGAVTVFVSMLLIPAILVTGTAVDMSTIYAGKAMLRNANEMAMNSLLSDYDELLRDLYGLFAVTADDAEMQTIVNSYLALTLFYDERASEGRVLFNNMEYSANIQPIPSANLQNKEILRRQIEEYVKLKAPAFLIEKVLDKIENFTKFLPDLTAVLRKLRLDESMALLYELYQQLYYRMRYHDWYIYDTQAKPDSKPNSLFFDDSLADPQGFEVKKAKAIDAILASSIGLNDHATRIQNAKTDYANKKQAYETAQQIYEEINKEYKESLLKYDQIKELSDIAITIFDPVDTIYGNAVTNYLQRVRNTLPTLNSDVNTLLLAVERHETEYNRIPKNASDLANALDAKKMAIDNLKGKLTNQLATFENDKNTKESNNNAYLTDMNPKQSAVIAAENKFYEEVSAAQAWASNIQKDVAQKQANDVYDALASGGKTTFGSWALEISNTASVVIDRWGFIGTVVNKVKNTLWCINPWEVIAEFEKHELSKIPPDDDSVVGFLNNIHDISALLTLIEYHRGTILADIVFLIGHLDKCSAALRGDDEKGMLKDVKAYRDSVSGVDMVGKQLGRIETYVTRNIEGSYFRRLGKYLENPMIKISGYSQVTLSEIIGAFDVGLETENSAIFNALLSAGNVETIPYFATLNEPGSPFKYTYFCDDNDTFAFYASLYVKYGDDSYWQYQWDRFTNALNTFVSVFFSGIADLIKELAKGAILDGDGASGIPLDIYFELRAREFEADYVPLLEDIVKELAAFGTGQGDVSGNIWNIVRGCTNLLENALKTYTMLGIFLETDGLLNQLAMVTYNTNMFSCYTTQEETSFQGYQFSKNLNYQLGWEQEYLILGAPNEAMCLAAASGMIFAARLVFNFIGTFTVPSVNDICMMDPEPITQAIVRFIFALGEAYIDIHQLRSGKEVPILKFLDEHWTFGNVGEMVKRIEKTFGRLMTGTVQKLVVAANAATNPSLPQLRSVIDNIDVKRIYSAGITMAALVRLEERHGYGAVIGSFWDGFSDAITRYSVDDLLKSADNINTRMMEWNGYKKENIGREEVWRYKGVSFKSVVDDVSQTERLEKLRTGQESKILSAEGSAFAKKVVDGAINKVWEAITPKMSYQDYISVFMFFTPPLSLVSRTQDLIAINMTNVMQNSGVKMDSALSVSFVIGTLLLTPVYKEKDLPLSKNGLFDLSKAHTAFELNTEAKIELLFMSSAFYRDNAEGDVPPGNVRFFTVSNRGY